MVLKQTQIDKISSVFLEAEEENRNVLYEYEVYRILETMGLTVPSHFFIENEENITEELLKPLGHTLILKVVSPEIIHKQKAGGVKRVDSEDPLFIQFVLSMMRKEIQKQKVNDKQPAIKGFLVCECVDYRPVLGNEVMFGIKTDESFGAVMTVSKGGDDAEFFAKHYDSANLFLPGKNYCHINNCLSQLKISYKYENQGHPEYSHFITETASCINNLAYTFSEAAGHPPTHFIRELDVNPFVITEDQRFVAIDGHALIEKNPMADKKRKRFKPESLNAFFYPKGLAVIGVSADKGKVSLGRDIALLLHNIGRSDLILINARGGETKIADTNYPLYTDLINAPAEAELVVYAAPARFSLDFIKSLKNTSVKAVIFISGIPGNMSYPQFEQALDEVKPEGLRIIGPNCMGVFQAPEKGFAGLNTLFIEEQRLELKSSERSNTALLTQSGALAVTEIDKMQNYRLFRSIVSFGNTYDVNLTDLVRYFTEDKNTKVIALYLEGLGKGEGREFFDLASRCTKPIILYKSGKTEAGARAAASHTASMSGNYDVFASACRQCGVILADKIEDHSDLVKAFSLLNDRKPENNRVAGVVNAGFESTVGADELKNLVQAEISEKTIEQLEKINTYGLVDTSTPFLDITPMADDRMYADFTECLLKDENVDCLFVSIVPHTTTLKTIPETCHHADSLANLLVELRNNYRKPIVVSVNGGRYYKEFTSILEKQGLPVYDSVRGAIKSLDTFVNYYM